MPGEIPIPKFKPPSHLSYVSNYPEDEVDWSEPTPPLPTTLPPPLPMPYDPTPCRNFRDPHAAAEEERERHFATHKRERLEKLIAASDALRDAPALTTTGTEDDLDSAERAAGSQEFDSTTAGEPDSVFVSASLRSQGRAPACDDDDLFSDVAEDGDSDGDDEEQWDAEFARAEVVEEEHGDVWQGCCPVGYVENAGISTLTNAMAGTRSEGAAKDPITLIPFEMTETRSYDAAKDTAPISTDPAAAPYVKHITATATRDWAYPVTGTPSPTESQLVASGFEFHNELSEEEQIARFGDKAFRKVLREVLPSLSRKQQWYAWRRVNEETVGDGDRGPGREGEGETEEAKEAKEESGECECRCPGNGEECDGDDGTCGKLLSECLCGNCGDCDEHYQWHHPDRACEIEGELGELAGGGRMPKCVCGIGGKEVGDEKTEPHEEAATAMEKHAMCKKGADREPNTFTPVCGCGGDERNCRCVPDRCTCEDCPTSQAQHHRPILNPEVKDRPSDRTGSFLQGRLIDGELVSNVREGLDMGHDVPASSVTRIPGLGLLDEPSELHPMHETIRHSVEPETPRRQLHRESTPAFEDRSPSPSPMSHKGNFEDVEMPDAPSTTTAAPPNSHPPLPQPTSSPDPASSPLHAVTAPQPPARPRSKSRSRSRSPAKAPLGVAPLPQDPSTSTPKSTKRSGRRKSAVQGSKVEKTSTSKSRAVSRKVTAAVKDAAEKAGNKVKEAVARIEASVKGEDESTPRRSARIRAKFEREGTPQYRDE